MNTRLIALKDIPGSIPIRAGQEFIEQDPTQAQYWITTKFARLKDERPLSAPIPVSSPLAPPANSSLPEQKAVNSRGWDGLFWDGFEVAILASGESLTEEQCEQVRGWRASASKRRVIAINTTFRRALWADLLYACDFRWWDTYHDEARENFTGELWTQDPPAAQKFADLHLIRSEKQRGLSTRPGIINQGNNSGYQAINLAFLAGATRMFLLGYDCKGGHWHGDHPAGLNSRLPFKVWLQEFQYLARHLDIEKVEVLNCSPGTALTTFKKTTLEEALK